jgi:uncharacterized protein YbjT (DUF2867 family)
VILAAGATGHLRPVVDLLLAHGHALRVTARDPARAAARELAARGAEVVRADLDDPASLRAAARGVDVVFAAGSPHQAGPAGEARHGINVADAVAATGVAHLVFASGAGAERPTGVPVFDSKHAVEQRIRALDVPHTILAPVYFMENAFNAWNLEALASGRFPLPLPPDRPLQQLAIEDVAAVAAVVLERPDDFAGERIELAGDELTGAEAAATLARVTGRRFIFQPVPPHALPDGLRALFEWLDGVGHHVDIPALRSRFPPVQWHSFERWAGVAAQLVAGRGDGRSHPSNA